MTLLTSATIGTGCATGLRRRRRRFFILAIGSGAGAGSACFFVRRFFLGMPRRLTSNQPDCEPGYLGRRSSQKNNG